MKAGCLIAVDWGSSQFRAYLLDRGGTVIEKTENNGGVFRQQDGGFANFLYASCDQWLNSASGLPVIMCGMIGSRQGWVETTYLKCPMAVRQLSQCLVKIPEVHANPVFIVPGITSNSISAFSDVIRGEETQIIGLQSKYQLADTVICLPGTHSKWVSVSGDQINGFTTFLTGELYTAIKTTGSIQSVIRIDEFNKAAFEEGIRMSRQPGGLSHHIFSVRSRLVSGESDQGAFSSYLSGILIGAEISAGLTFYPEIDKITLIGNRVLLHQYGLAFAEFDIGVEPISSDGASVNGLWKIAITSARIRRIIDENHAG